VKSLFLTFILSLFIIGCQSKVVYEENIPVNTYDWAADDTLKYEIDIEDTAEKYDLSVNVRHRDIYDFTNLYIKIQTRMPSGESKSEIVSLPLSDDAGKWLGKCSGDICFNRIYLMRKLIFPSKGKYTFLINQEMRQDHLKNILDLGLKIEKAKRKTYTEEDAV
jgi:gliding motility-associated lipoprotein GldH